MVGSRYIQCFYFVPFLGGTDDLATSLDSSVSARDHPDPISPPGVQTSLLLQENPAHMEFVFDTRSRIRNGWAFRVTLRQQQLFLMAQKIGSSPSQRIIRVYEEAAQLIPAFLRVMMENLFGAEFVSQLPASSLWDYDPNSVLFTASDRNFDFVPGDVGTLRVLEDGAPLDNVMFAVRTIELASRLILTGWLSKDPNNTNLPLTM